MVAVLGVALGLAMVAVGAVVVRHAYTITQLEEELDAVGSARPGTVEPADWHVTVTRVFGGVVVAVGGVVLLLALLD